MKRLLWAGVVVGAVAVAVSAKAVELPLPMNPYEVTAPLGYSWSACFVGASGGFGFAATTLRDAPFSSVIDTSGLGRTVSLSGNGAIFGGELGCDYQFSPHFVAGVAASGAGAMIAVSASDPFAGVTTLKSKNDALADLSGRLGFAWNRLLLYGKGGAAFTHNSFSYIGGGLAGSGVDTPIGGIVGAGVAFAFTPNWSAFVEYDHYFFGSETVALDFPGGFAPVTVGQSMDAVKAGVDYRFSFWPEPARDR